MKKSKTLSPEQIISISKKRGFKFKHLTFSTSGKYSIKDSMFNHRDISHYNHLHKKMTKHMKHEVIHQGEVTTFMRYYSFLGFSIPMVAQLMDVGKNQIIEVFTSMFFQFVKVNTEKQISENECLSVLDFYIGSKSQFLLMLGAPFFNKIVKESFDDYINEDVPYLETRAQLRPKGYNLTKDTEPFTHHDTFNLQLQNIYLTNNVKSKETNIKINDLENNKIKIINDIDVFGFQISKINNIIRIFPRLCPHEGGCLDVDNSYGDAHTYEKFLKKQQVKCVVHNRAFSPLMTIDLEKLKSNYETNLFMIKVYDNVINIKFKDDVKNFEKLDWTK